MNMKMASILCLVIMLAGCVAGQQRGLVGDTYVSSSQPALALKARELPLMGSTMGASRLTSSGAMGGLIVDSWITVYGKGDGASPLAIVPMANCLTAGTGTASCATRSASMKVWRPSAA